MLNGIERMAVACQSQMTDDADYVPRVVELGGGKGRPPLPPPRQRSRSRSQSRARADDDGDEVMSKGVLRTKFVEIKDAGNEEYKRKMWVMAIAKFGEGITLYQ